MASDLIRAVFGYAERATRQVIPEVMRLLSVLKGTMDRQSLYKYNALELKAKKNFRQVYLRPALDAEMIEMTIPDKPRSSKQMYRSTGKGRKFLVKIEGGGKDARPQYSDGSSPTG